MADADRHMHIALVSGHEVCHVQVVMDVPSRFDCLVWGIKNGKAVVRLKFDHETLVAFDCWTDDASHTANHGEIVNNSVSLDRSREAGHVQNKDCSFLFERIRDLLV